MITTKEWTLEIPIVLTVAMLAYLAHEYYQVWVQSLLAHLYRSWVLMLKTLGLDKDSQQQRPSSDADAGGSTLGSVSTKPPPASPAAVEDPLSRPLLSSASGGEGSGCRERRSIDIPKMQV